jgi:hypothetical protein
MCWIAVVRSSQCAVWRTPAQAVAILQKAGFDQVANLAGGCCGGAPMGTHCRRRRVAHLNPSPHAAAHFLVTAAAKLSQRKSYAPILPA